MAKFQNNYLFEGIAEDISRKTGLKVTHFTECGGYECGEVCGHCVEETIFGVSECCVLTGKKWEQNPNRSIVVGMLIGAMRKTKELNGLRQLAEKSGISYGRLCGVFCVKNGKKLGPFQLDEKVYEKLASVLGLDCQKLFEAGCLDWDLKDRKG